MKPMRVAAGLILAASATPVIAANCEVGARPGTAAQDVYDPFSPANTVLTFEILATNAGDKDCNVRFYVAPLGGELVLNSDGHALGYRVEAPRAAGGPEANEHGPFTARVPAGGTSTIQARFTVPAQQVVPRGDYEGQLLLRGRTEGNEPVAFAGGDPVLRLRVQPRVEMSISGTAAASYAEHDMAPASIDLGVAQTGESGRVFVNVWSNGSVLVTLDSQNNGVLRLVEDESLPPIDYLATFDGQRISLATPHAVQRTPPMSIRGSSYELAVTLGDVSGKFAGQYKDVITVTVDQN